jgi:hypothetical protein
MFIARGTCAPDAVRRSGRCCGVESLLDSRSSERRRQEGIVASYKHLTLRGETNSPSFKEQTVSHSLDSVWVPACISSATTTNDYDPNLLVQIVGLTHTLPRCGTDSFLKSLP